MRPFPQKAKSRIFPFAAPICLYAWLALLVLLNISQIAFADNAPCDARVVLAIQPDTRVSLDKPIAVTLESDHAKAVDPVDVQFLPDKDFDVTPNTVHLGLGTGSSIKLVLKAANPGLIHLVATVSNWPPSCRKVVDIPLDVGFRQVAHLETNLAALRPDSSSMSKADIPPLDGNNIESFKIRLKDISGQRLEVGAPITVLLHSNFASLSENGSEWKSDLSFVIPQDHDESEIVYFRPSRIAVQKGTIDVHLKKDSGTADIMSDQLIYSSRHIWWIYLLVTLGGALAYSLVEALLGCEKNARKFAEKLFEGYGFKLLAALVIGGLAYFLRETSVLGRL